MTATFVPLVEGYGEVEAVGPLLRRLAEREQRYDVAIARPFRVKRTKVVKAGELERSLEQAVISRNASAAIVLLDADDDCPVELADDLLKRATATVAEPVSIVIATIEFESWFLAAKSSLRGQCGLYDGAADVPEPESIRDAKGRLSANMRGDRRYIAVDDQPSLATTVDLSLAEANARSFRKLCEEMRRLLGLFP